MKCNGFEFFFKNQIKNLINIVFIAKLSLQPYGTPTTEDQAA